MKIFVEADYYIEVDDGNDFRVTSDYGVGSAGCVVMLKATGKLPHALKIPLLRATNLAENLQVCRLLTTEWSAVSGIKQGRNLAKMVAARAPVTLSAPLLIDPDASEVRQKNGVILVAFASDGRPIVTNSAILVDYTPKGDELRALKKLLNGNLRQNAENNPKKTLYFLERQLAPEDGHLPKLEDGVMDEKGSRPIFINVPSITYEWLPRNLQADISTSLVDSASYFGRMEVVSRMLEAVDSLHSSDVLHCDIRPANIFRSDETIPKGGYDTEAADRVCGGYVLGDFGSLNDHSNREHDARAAFGDSFLGPAVAALRTSLFYAPERRIAGEFEDADHVTISPIQNGQCRVDLEWKHYAHSPTDLRLADKVPDIRSGDSLRVRDLVLFIRSTTPERAGAERSANVTASFLCDATVARIVHNRLSILETLKDRESFQISGYVVLRQWSRATDMFSIGVLLLYLLFVKQPRMASSNAKPLETKFAECLETITAKPYFEAFWPRLSLFTSAALKARQDKREVYDCKIVDVDKQAAPIIDYARTVTNDLTASCPFLDYVFRSVDGNSARFLLNIWFAMACIHRAEDLAGGSVEDKFARPFCSSRTVMKNDDGPTQARRAFNVFANIQALVDPNSTALNGFELTKVNQFSLQSDYVVRLQLNAIQEEIAQLGNAVQAYDGSVVRAVGAKNRAVIDRARALSEQWATTADTKDAAIQDFAPADPSSNVV